MGKEEAARKRLEKLEKDPKHTKPTPAGLAQTRTDDLDDPKFQAGGEIDSRWKQDKNGNWYHPDLEG